MIKNIECCDQTLIIRNRSWGGKSVGMQKARPNPPSSPDHFSAQAALYCN